ncbi:DUF1439 domain-containing protein [Flavobacterium sp. W21_SRS_FM6]|uniref:DUF1439 domain-containing protein n=1 Tax=Flavobacterium sp. W21_SRS_FM6 TaxID=3240268 RepID=UPI003F927722
MMKWFFILSCYFCSLSAHALSYTVTISQDELQSRVEALMPIEKTKMFVTVLLSNPRVELSEHTDQIELFCHITISAPGGLGGQGSVNLIGSLRYESEQGAFFLIEPQIRSIESKDVAEKHLAKVQQIAQIALEQCLSAKPIYRFKDNKMRDKLAKAVLQSVTVENKQLLIELGMF